MKLSSTSFFENLNFKNLKNDMYLGAKKDLDDEQELIRKVFLSSTISQKFIHFECIHVEKYWFDGFAQRRGGRGCVFTSKLPLSRYGPKIAGCPRVR
jgi:hypothetical protein